MPGQTITEDDRKKIDPKFICTVCALLLCEPMQTPCGHLLCYACLHMLLSSSSPKCSLDGTILTKKEVFPDALKKRELMGLHLHCPNEGCVWSGTYKDLQDHLHCCDHALIQCVHHQCKKQIKRSLLAQHLDRQSTCPHCNEKLAFNLLEETKCQEIHHNPWFIENIIYMLLASVVWCYGTMKQLVWSLLTEMKNILLEMVGGIMAIMVTGLRKIAEIIDALQLQMMRVARLLDAIDRNQRLENESREKDLKLARLQFDVTMAEAKLLEVQRQSHVTTNCNGILLWRIDDFTIKRRGAVSGVQTFIYSPPFYTSQFGYKMCAKVYMNGDESNKDTHFSLYIVVMKGEYDALLPWPFQKKITMMLLDQNNGDHIIDAFRSDAESSSFQRPKNDMNIASGSPLFMPLSNGAYVKDDTMFIKIIVD